jgi:hypothetical protein
MMVLWSPWNESFAGFARQAVQDEKNNAGMLVQPLVLFWFFLIRNISKFEIRVFPPLIF